MATALGLQWVLTAASIAGHTQVTVKSRLSRKIRAATSIPWLTSGALIATRAPTAATQHSEATIALSTEQAETIPADLAAQGPDPSTDDQSILQGTSEVHKVTWTRTGTAPSSTSDPATDPDYLRWNATPFRLESIENNRYCPRLDVEPDTALSSILPPASYSLDSAVIQICDHGIAVNPLPSEARRILTVYNVVHRLDLTKPFSSSDHTLSSQISFHKELEDSIALPGHKIEKPDEPKGIGHLKSMDYAEQMAVTSPSAPSSSPGSETPQVSS